MMPTIEAHRGPRRAQGARSPACPSGFEDLDRLTSGFQHSDLVIIAGRPSMGKTSFALNIAENAAIQHQQHVAVLSLEMSKEQLALRMLCSQSEVPLYKIRSGHLSDERLSGDWSTSPARALQGADHDRRHRRAHRARDPRQVPPSARPRASSTWC